MMKLTKHLPQVAQLRHTKQKGFSLIELMIAMVLGLLLMAGVINIFLASNQTYRLQDAMFRMQESGRFALSTILKDARDAGFQDVLPGDTTRTKSIQAVQGAVEADKALLKDKDGVSVTVVSSVSSDIFFINSHDGFSDGAVAYYIATDAGSQLSLFKNGNASVEGVEGLIVQYGRDTDGDREADQFDDLAAMPATGWVDVVAVRVNLYVVSGNSGLLDVAQAAMFTPFDTVDTSDRRLYQAYSSTVALRNKMP
jgi:type IV pilus assembly protein PilW